MSKYKFKFKSTEAERVAIWDLYVHLMLKHNKYIKKELEKLDDNPNGKKEEYEIDRSTRELGKYKIVFAINERDAIYMLGIHFVETKENLVFIPSLGAFSLEKPENHPHPNFFIAFATPPGYSYNDAKSCKLYAIPLDNDNIYNINRLKYADDFFQEVFLEITNINLALSFPGRGIKIK